MKTAVRIAVHARPAGRRAVDPDEEFFRHRRSDGRAPSGEPPRDPAAALRGSRVRCDDDPGSSGRKAVDLDVGTSRLRCAAAPDGGREDPAEVVGEV